MFKKVLVLVLICSFYSFVSAKEITENMCNEKEEGFIYAGNECINYAMFEGDDNDKLIIIVHGTWDEGSNVLGRYAPREAVFTIVCPLLILYIYVFAHSEHINFVIQMKIYAYDHTTILLA